jgi:hypothetical protein
MTVRTIRVYDKTNGDFTIDVPDDAKVTFGYFNPASAGQSYDNRYQHNPGNSNVAKQTALRVYTGKTERSNQMACFIGVDGFRDESLNFTRIDEKIKGIAFKKEGDKLTAVEVAGGYN